MSRASTVGLLDAVDRMWPLFETTIRLWPVSMVVYSRLCPPSAVNNQIITMTMFMVLSSWHSHCESTPGSWMQTERRVAANPQTKPTDLGCESADRLLSSAMAYITG